MRVKLLKAWPYERKNQTDGVLPPTAFSEWLSDQSEAVARVAAIIPAEYVNTAFPGKQTKFDLLNGWRLPSKGINDRTAYQRARWFLTRQGASRLTFSISSPEDAPFS